METIQLPVYKMAENQYRFFPANLLPLLPAPIRKATWKKIKHKIPGWYKDDQDRPPRHELQKGNVLIIPGQGTIYAYHLWAIIREMDDDYPADLIFTGEGIQILQESKGTRSRTTIKWQAEPRILEAIPAEFVDRRSLPAGETK